VADNPTTGKPDNKPGFPSSGSDIFFGLIKGAISVFNPRPDVKPIDVIKASPAWHDPVALQRTRDRWEDRTGRLMKNVPPKQVGAVTAANANLFRQIDAQLAKLRGQPRWADVPEPENLGAPIDQQTAPIFRTPGFGGPILGIGAAGGMTAAQKEILFRGSVFAKKIGAGMNRAQVAAKIAKLPSVSFEKVIGVAGEVLKKVPKGLLPDAELVGLVKQLGKALKGGKFTVIGLAGQKLGEIAIEKAAAIAQRMNDERATKILGPMNSKDWNARKVAAQSAGPIRRGRYTGAQKAAEKAVEPVRPKVQQNTGSPNQHPGSRATVARGKAPSPLEEIKQVKVYAKKYATPAQMKGTAKVPARGITRSKVVFGIAKAIGSLGNAALMGKIGAARGSARGFSGSSFLEPVRASQSQSFAQQVQPGVKTATTVGTSCYTVCRKKSTGKKKRRKPRICISPSKASRLGII